MAQCRTADLSGQQFQDLTIIKQVPNIRKQPKRCWLCKCKCGKEIILDTSKLKVQKSCGCNNIAHVQKSNSKRYPYLYKRWHYYKQLDQLSDEFWPNRKHHGCRKCVHASILKRKYNLDYQDYLQIRQDCNNLCQICKKDRPLVVDHCHTTGKVRGLLCSQCNSGLGHIKDNVDYLKKMIEYLERGTTDIDWVEYPCQRKHDPVDDTCPITGETPEVLDHCHDTGKVRGNIGWSANIALGHFKDNKEVINSAMTYLTNV
jgi:hypothetical protein